MGIRNAVLLSDILEAVVKRQPILNIASISKDVEQTKLFGIGSLVDAEPGQLTFVSNTMYLNLLPNTNAGAVFITSEMLEKVPESVIPIIVKSPYLAYASATHLFDRSTTGLGKSQLNRLIHPTAEVSDSAVIGSNVSIGAYTVIDDHVTIGDGTVIQSHVRLEKNVVIGADCVINSHVSIAHDCQIGNQVRIHAHASIGSEGFGFAPTLNPAVDGWERIAQLGRVIIGNHVRIGSHTCIDRGAIDDTVIEDNVIIDNLVQIAHNVHIGAGTAIAANSGIAGSTTIGKRCIIAGAVGIVGHIEIVDDVTLTGMTLVTKSIKKSGSYSSGTVAMPTMEWRRAVVNFRNSGKK